MANKFMSESELRSVVASLVRKVLIELLGINQLQHQRQWYKASDAAQLLDLDTADHLHDLRLAGDLKEGKHWRLSCSVNAKRPSYQYHIGNCRQLLESARS